MRIEAEAGSADRRAEAPDDSSRAAGSSSPVPATPNESPVATPGAVDCRRESLPVARPAPVSIAPLAPGRYRIQLTVSRETHDKFRHAQALLRHVVPSGDAAEIFDRAVTLLVDQLERQRFAQIERARATKPGPGPSRHIPAAVRRAVWRRDGGSCAFVGAEGRCGERAFLEFHHVEPHAVGGGATVENIELRCRAHNAYRRACSSGLTSCEKSVRGGLTRSGTSYWVPPRLASVAGPIRIPALLRPVRGSRAR